MMLATKQKLQSFYLITNDYVHWKINGMKSFQFKIKFKLIGSILTMFVYGF